MRGGSTRSEHAMAVVCGRRHMVCAGVCGLSDGLRRAGVTGYADGLSRPEARDVGRAGHPALRIRAVFLRREPGQCERSEIAGSAGEWTMPAGAAFGV